MVQGSGVIVAIGGGKRAGRIEQAIEEERQFTTVFDTMETPVTRAGVAFVSINGDKIDYVGLVRPGRRVATGQKSISVSHLAHIGVDGKRLLQNLPSRFSGRVSLNHDGVARIPPKTWEALVRAVEATGKDAKAGAARLDQLRDKHIAHFEWPQQAESRSAPRPAISSDEIERLYKAVHELFGACCLTTQYIVDTDEYLVGKPPKKAIDRLLEMVAGQSYYVNEPEIRGTWWPSDRTAFSCEELDELNCWRKKFGLPPA